MGDIEPFDDDLKDASRMLPLYCGDVPLGGYEDDFAKLNFAGGVELGLKSALSPEYLDRTKAATEKELGGMGLRRFREPRPGEINEHMKKHAQSARLLYAEKRLSPEELAEGQTLSKVKGRLVIQDLKIKRPIEKTSTFAATPGLDKWRLIISTFRPDLGHVLFSDDAVQAFHHTTE